MDTSMTPACDYDCAGLGWIEATATVGMWDAHISHHPDADLDGRFLAFDHDAQELVRITGWLMRDYERIR